MVAETTRALTADERSARPSKKAKGPEHPRAERLSQELAEVAAGERTMASVAKALAAAGLEAGGMDVHAMVVHAAIGRIGYLPDDALADLEKAVRKESNMRRRAATTNNPERKTQCTQT